MPAPVPIGPTPLLVRLRIVLPIDPAVVMKARQQPATPPPLPYHFVDQEEPNWCWAAVAEGVAHTYDPASSSSQCGIANAVLGRLDCCPPPGGNHPCNCTHNLVDPLKEVGRYGGRTPPTFGLVRDAINQRRVVGIYIDWGDGDGGHFLAIYGYETSADGYSVLVADPAFPDYSTPVWDLQHGRYQGFGQWADLYFTTGHVP